jgi:hypothetical protein
MIPWRDLAAVTACVDENSASRPMEEILRHEAIVEAVRRQGPALPVRFGTVFRDARSVASALADRYELLVGDLHRVGTRVEVSLTALWVDHPSGDAPGPERTGRGAGARYLYARAAETRRDDAVRARARRVADDLDRMVGGRALERRVSLLPTPRVAVRAAYLLDPAELDGFRMGFEEARRARDDLRLLLTGPWPPYSFVTRREGDGTGASDGRLAAIVQLVADEMGGRPG